MSLVLDLVCIILIWIMAVGGYKKGLVKGLFGVASFLISGIVTAIIYKPVSSYIISIPFVQDKLLLAEEKLQILIGNSQQQAFLKLPEWVCEISGKMANETNVALSSAITNILVSVLSIVVVYLLVKLSFHLFEGLLDAIMKLPVLNLLNRAGGTACGVISAVALLWVILAIVVLFAGTTFFASVNEAIQSTNVLKYFYNNNLLIKLIIS